MRTPIMKNVVQRSWSLFILLAVIVIPVAIPAASTSVIPHALPSTETTTAALDLLAALVAQVNFRDTGAVGAMAVTTLCVCPRDPRSPART